MIKKIKYGIKDVSVKDRQLVHRGEDMIYCCAAQQSFDSWPKLLLKLACEEPFGVDFTIFSCQLKRHKKGPLLKRHKRICFTVL